MRAGLKGITSSRGAGIAVERVTKGRGEVKWRFTPIRRLGVHRYHIALASLFVMASDSTSYLFDTLYFLSSHTYIKMQALMNQLQGSGMSSRQVASGETILADK